MLSFLPQSRSGSCWSSPPSVEIARERRRHKFKVVVQGVERALPRSHLGPEALAVTRSPPGSKLSNFTFTFMAHGRFLPLPRGPEAKWQRTRDSSLPPLRGASTRQGHCSQQRPHRAVLERPPKETAGRLEPKWLLCLSLSL